MKAKEIRYFRDHDHDDLIARVWYDEKGNRHGECWIVGQKDDKWGKADSSAFMVADDIYDHHELSDEEVEKITGLSFRES